MSSLDEWQAGKGGAARRTMKPQKISAPNNEKAIEKPMLTVEKAEMKPRMSPQKMRMSVLAKRKGPRKPKSTLLKKVKMVSVMKMKHVSSAEMMICRPARAFEATSKSAR